MKLNRFGDVYIAGTRNPSTPSSSIFLAKFNTDGELLWDTYDDRDFGWTVATALDIDSSGNAYVAGYGYLTDSTGLDWIVIKYRNAVCPCLHQADLNDDGLIDALDLNAMIDVLFFLGNDPQDPDCPATRADFNNSGESDALDLNDLIDYLFFSGDGPVNPCSP